MKKGTITRYEVIRYKELSSGMLFPYPTDNHLYRKSTAHKILQRMQADDFANTALYGLARWTFPAADPVKHKTIEP